MLFLKRLLSRALASIIVVGFCISLIVLSPVFILMWLAFVIAVKIDQWGSIV